MASKIVIRLGVASGVYDDRLLGLYEALGVPVIRRASDVEFDHDRRCWVARSASDGAIIATGRNRAEVIAAEVEFLERGL